MSKKNEVIYDMTDPKYWEARSRTIERLVFVLGSGIPEPREPKGFDRILKEIDEPKK